MVRERYRALAVAFLIWNGIVFGLPSVDQFHRELAIGLRSTKKLRIAPRSPEKYGYLLVGGILSDYLRNVGYLKVFQAELVAQGVPSAQINTLFPPSQESVEDNAATAFPVKWQAITAKSDRPLVIVAHSKGAVEVVHFLLNHPELIDRVEAVFCVQGAFGGSELADFLMREYETPGRPVHWWARQGISLFRTFDYLFHRKIAGVESLTTARSSRRTVSWYQEHADALKRLIPKLIFTTTQADLKEMDVKLRVGGNYLKSVGVLENDGALGVNAQHIMGISSQAVSISGIDHALPCGNIIARRHDARARAFIRAVVRATGF